MSNCTYHIIKYLPAILILTVTLSVYGGWVTSSSPPPGFSTLLMRQNVDVYFQGANVGTAHIVTHDNYMTIKEISSLNLKNYGLKAACVPEVLAALNQPDICQNTQFLCEDPQKLSLTYKDLCKPVHTEKVTMVLNAGNNHLYLFVSPKWIDTRINSQPRHLPDSTSGWSYYVNNYIDYARFQTRNSTELTTGLNQTYGFSVGNTLFQGNLYGSAQNNHWNRWGVQNIYGTTHNHGRIYKGGMLTLPQFNNIIQHEYLGLQMGNDMQTMNTSTSQGTPIVLTIDSTSQVIIRKQGTQQVLYADTLYPGTQQIDTSRFLEGIYPIRITVTDEAGHTKNTTRVYIKNKQIPVTGHPNYHLGLGWLRNNRGTSWGDINVPDYDYAFPTLFADITRASSYNSALTFGIFNDKKNVVTSVMDSIYGNSYFLTLSGLASSGGSFGTGSTGTYMPNKLLSFYGQFSKTWAGSDRYVTTTYRLSSGTSLSWHWLNTGFSAFLGSSTSNRSSLSYDYGVTARHTWNIPVGRDMSAIFDVETGYNNNGLNALLTFTYGYSHKNNQLEFQSLVSSRNPNTGENTFTFAPSLYGKVNYSDADRQLIAREKLRYHDHFTDSNTSFSYTSNALTTGTGFNTTASTKSLTSYLNAGVVGNNNMISPANLDHSNGYAGVVINITADRSIPYQVLINGIPYGYGQANIKNFISLEPFQSYTVSIVPDSVSYAVSEKNFTATLYPGNIENITGSFNHKIIIITNLIDDRDKPLPNAYRINSAGDFAASDTNGDIQFSIFDNQQKIIFKTDDHKTCEVTMSEKYGEESEKYREDFIYKKHTVCHPVKASSDS